MKNWIKRQINSIKFRNARKLTATFVRDDSGRWLINPETGTILKKTDDPKLIALAIARSKKRTETILEGMRSEKTCKCGGDGLCPCENGSRMRHPAKVAKENKLTEEKSKATQAELDESQAVLDRLLDRRQMPIGHNKKTSEEKEKEKLAVLIKMQSTKKPAPKKK